MKILVAGSNTKGGTTKEMNSRVVTISELCKWYGVDKLYSFMSEENYIRDWDDNYFLMVDSGAHSWNKDDDDMKVGMKKRSKLPDMYEFLERYFKFIETHKEKKMVFVEFDVYRRLSVEFVDEYYNKVQALGGKKKFIRVYHPVLDGGSLSVFKKWVEQGQEYIGIGNDSTYLLDQIFNITRNKVRVHGFAMTKLWMMEQYPFYSVDSTSPLSTVIFGRYSTPIMAMKDRQEIREANSIECFDDGFTRMEKAVIETAMTEQYLTELWAKKGIIWQDMNW